MKHLLSFVAPLDDVRNDRLMWFKHRALASGYAVTSSYEPGLERNGFVPRLFVRVETPEVHISTPIGQLMTWGVVQYGRDTTDTPDRRRPAAA